MGKATVSVQLLSPSVTPRDHWLAPARLERRVASRMSLPPDERFRSAQYPTMPVFLRRDASFKLLSIVSCWIRPSGRPSGPPAIHVSVQPPPSERAAGSARVMGVCMQSSTLSAAIAVTGWARNPRKTRLSDATRHAPPPPSMRPRPGPWARGSRRVPSMTDMTRSAMYRIGPLAPLASAVPPRALETRGVA